MGGESFIDMNSSPIRVISPLEASISWFCAYGSTAVGSGCPVQVGELAATSLLGKCASLMATSADARREVSD